MHFRYFSSEQTFRSAACNEHVQRSPRTVKRISRRIVYMQSEAVYFATITQNATQVSRRSGLAKKHSLVSLSFSLSLFLFLLCTRIYAHACVQTHAHSNWVSRDSVWSTRVIKRLKKMSRPGNHLRRVR